MQRGLWASLRSFRGIKRHGFTRLISSTLNNTGTDLTKFKMHKGGIRNQSEFSRGGGRRGGRGHHPSGLSGKQIGLWYAAKGKRNRKDRELKQRAYVTMESHHEEKITELLGKIRADESSDLNDGGAEPGPSFPRGQSDISLKGSYQGPEMYTSNYGRTDPGPSSQTDWYDSAQESYQGNELNVGYDVAGCAMNTVAFGNHFTDEAEQVHFQCPDEMFQSNDGSFNQSQSSHGFLQQDPALDHYLKDDQERKLLSGTTRYKEMQEFRKRLPAHDKKEVLHRMIKDKINFRLIRKYNKYC